MKIIDHITIPRLLILFYFISITPNISGQNLESVISHKYSTSIYDLKPMSKGRWVLAVQDLSIPGALGEHFMSLVIVDSFGRYERYIPLDFQYVNETSSIGPLWVLPNDEFIVRYQTGNCDAGFHAFEIEKVDTLGNVLWHQFMPLDKRISTLHVLPDGNILVPFFNNITKLSSQTGEVIWETLKPFSPPDTYLHVPGTEDLITSDSTGIKYYELQGDSSAVSYVLSDSAEFELDSGSFKLRGYDQNGFYYGVKTSTNELFRFDFDLNLEFVTNVPPLNVHIANNRFVVMDLHPTQIIQVFDFSSNLISEYKPLKIEGFNLNKMFVLPDGLAVIGNYISGPKYNPDLGFDLYGRGEGWFRFFPGFDFSEAKQQFSMAITGIMITEEVDIDSFYEAGPDYTGYLYNIHNGKFNIEVTNTGTEPVNSFSINITFEEIVNFWFCPPTSAVFTSFENQTISPGESLWVEFEGLTALKQKSIPQEFCFWTSNINYRPDDIPADDMYCYDRIVGIIEETRPLFQIYPNPTSKEIEINFSNEFSGSEWSLIDTYGRILKKGEFLQPSTSINITALPNGIYFLVGDHFSEKIIVCH